MKLQKPVYLLAGGNWRTPSALVPLMKKVLLATGNEKPRVVYIGTANGDDPSFFGFSNIFFKQAGAGAVEQVFLASAQADVKAAQSVLRAADAVFVSGGDVDEGMRWLQEHKLVAFLQNLQAKGVLFFGLSAGSIMLGQQWVRWQDPKDDATAELFDCLGIAPLLCDTHAETDKWEELQTAVSLLGKDRKGYGIPTGGVLCVGPDGTLVALEKNVVCYQNQAGQAVQIRNLDVKG